jgi:NRAMP (natural resistance-associated macrophage protein)-like metal ion transporter
MQHVGPGLLISIAYLDPGNRKIFHSKYLYFLNYLVSGDLDAGRAAGYHLLWLLMLSTTIGFFFQTLSINLGVITSLIIPH